MIISSPGLHLASELIYGMPAGYIPRVPHTHRHLCFSVAEHMELGASSVCEPVAIKSCQLPEQVAFFAHVMVRKGDSEREMDTL